MKVKYPRTPHLPWSPGASDDDVFHRNLHTFEDQQVVVSENMDGEYTTLYRDAIHARSLDSPFHPSRTWVKALQGEIGYLIPSGWRVCGENLYAKHSIAYEALPSYFLAFSIWDQDNICLSWQESLAFFKQWGVATPKVLYQGLWCEKTMRAIQLNRSTQEGYVVRLAARFHYDDFLHSVAKWVRAQHVTTDQHWMKADVVPNHLASDALNSHQRAMNQGGDDSDA